MQALSPVMILAVALGGSAGAVVRYVVMSVIGHWYHGGLPLATLAVNLVGSFILGALIETMALMWSPSPALRAFLVVGTLGAFTTFSTFSMDMFFLMERGEFMPLAGYVLSSVIFGFLAFWGGMAALRLLIS
ncbi:fluoride efflux transporter CrcB [Varunaivibrio sulfuroxidans]|uniref:Fluoride-specific ion channel FluC n=1 Tax=Varunaivibrio sulfuroxidans TaxID=1773489 RepID=A0A4R3J8B4_9PROT|nr:fluoride efflux transporter CrcB [Varunaivibrio sulfuroxidans]TCS62078.1 CrcB protein [Varunaivibrio sulfuroxidans]WES30511.1 fluoride efflux transporter CrcB [Varunaivibrio sulfuroxidans]